MRQMFHVGIAFSTGSIALNYQNIFGVISLRDNTDAIMGFKTPFSYKIMNGGASVLGARLGAPKFATEYVILFQFSSIRIELST